jgi:hypothetical protein
MEGENFGSQGSQLAVALEKKNKCEMGKDIPVHATKSCMGIRGISLIILNLCTRWRSQVNFMPRTLTPFHLYYHRYHQLLSKFNKN